MKEKKFCMSFAVTILKYRLMLSIKYGLKESAEAKPYEAVLKTHICRDTNQRGNCEK